MNVDKLRERSQQLKQLAKDVQEDSSLKMVLVELRAMIQTPIRPHPSGYCNGSPPLNGDASSASNEQIDDENLPAQIIKILGKGTFFFLLLIFQRLIKCRGKKRKE